MALPVLAGLALRFGAPLVAKVLKDNIGGAAGNIAGSVVETVAGQLGVESREDAIVQESNANPESVGAAFRQAEAEHEVEILRLLASMSAEVNETMRGERAATSLLQRIWRPLFGIFFGLSFAAQVLAVVISVLAGNTAAINALANLSGYLMALNTVGAAVLGVYVWKRSDEKLADRA